MRMLVVGAGSTGGYFGGRLAQAGRDVTFLVRPKRAQQLRSRGLQVVSPHGDFTVMPQLVTADEISGPFDIIFLTVKAFALEAAIADLAPAVGGETMILPVLNGMRHMDTLAARFGRDRVVGCALKVVSALDDEGRVIQFAKLQDVAYGEMNGTETDRIRRLDAFMKGAGFDARLSPAIEQEMWDKWVQLATLGAANCLMRGTIGEIATSPGGKQVVSQLLDEVVAVVRAEGHPPSEALVAGVRAVMTDEGSTLTSSMYRDLEAGNRIEADQIIGDLLARAKDAGVETPLLDAVNVNLGVYQKRQAASPAGGAR